MGIYATKEKYFNYEQHCKQPYPNYQGKKLGDGCHCQIKFLLFKVNFEFESFEEEEY